MHTAEFEEPCNPVGADRPETDDDARGDTDVLLDVDESGGVEQRARHLLQGPAIVGGDGHHRRDPLAGPANVVGIGVVADVATAGVHRREQLSFPTP